MQLAQTAAILTGLVLMSETGVIATDTPKGAIDVAPFARVMTWDPARMDGARASRIEEYRAEDLFFGTDLFADRGVYSAPVHAGNLNCIGLEWMERRRLKEVGLQLDKSAVLPLDSVQVQAWVGESKWQGGWQPIKGQVKQQGDRLTLAIDPTGNKFSQTGTPRLRWIIPGSGDSIRVRRLWAHTTAAPFIAEIALMLAKPQRVTIETYNGYLEDGATKRTWDGKGTLRLSVLCCDTTACKLDRTVVRLRARKSAIAVAVDDVLERDCVYVPEAGLFVSKGSSNVTLSDYLKSIAGRETILERVRKMPDQTFEQAMAKSRNPIQDLGQTVLGLACDNSKFVVEREGALSNVRHSDAPVDTLFGAMPCYRLLVPQFGSGKNEGLKRYLDGDWMPAQVNSVQENGIVYTQRSFVAPAGAVGYHASSGWINDKPLCVVELTAENTSAQAADGSLRLAFFPGPDTDRTVELHQMDGGVAVQIGGRLLVWTDLAEASPLSARVDGAVLLLNGRLPAGKRARCVAYLPAWEAKPEDRALLTSSDKLFAAFQDYWKRAMVPSMKIELPNKFVENLIVASQVRCLADARSEANGERVSPWIAATFYGPLESEANSVVTAMCLMGQEEFARRSLDYFIHRYKPEGYLTTGYTLMGMGWHLWALSDYYKLYENKSWLKANSAKIDRLCQWIAAQTEKTKKLDPSGDKLPEYGLMPPGVYADWNSFFYGFSLDGYYYRGLAEAANALAEIGIPDAKKLEGSAQELRRNILRAYEHMQAITPVVPLKDGTWVRPYPSGLFVPGPVGNFFPGEDTNRSWCYDVEAGSHQMVALGILDPNSRHVTEMMDHMEDVQFLSEGWLDYPAAKSEEDWFNLGGFAKVQPYYARNCEVYALRDDVKPFVRSYFNTLASMVSTENMTFWECFNCFGAFDKTHETGYFLQQSRLMLVMEHGEELWLNHFTPNNWMKDGMVVAASNAPTAFGPVSFRITSHVSQGYIEATIAPPARRQPVAIVIRLRHPEGGRIKSVTVNGRAYSDFDSARETIRIKPVAGKIVVLARY